MPHHFKLTLNVSVYASTYPAQAWLSQNIVFFLSSLSTEWESGLSFNMTMTEGNYRVTEGQDS